MSISSRSTIGDVVIVDGDTTNPYTATHISGSRRADLLVAFRDGGDTGSVSFWFAPAGGGARLLTSPDEVDWSGMRR